MSETREMFEQQERALASKIEGYRARLRSIQSRKEQISAEHRDNNRWHHANLVNRRNLRSERNALFHALNAERAREEFRPFQDFYETQGNQNWANSDRLRGALNNFLVKQGEYKEVNGRMEELEANDYYSPGQKEEWLKLCTEEALIRDFIQALEDLLGSQRLISAKVIAKEDELVERNSALEGHVTGLEREVEAMEKPSKLFAPVWETRHD